MNFVKIAEGHYINLDQVAEIRQDGEKYKAGDKEHTCKSWHSAGR